MLYSCCFVLFFYSISKSVRPKRRRPRSGRITPPHCGNIPALRHVVLPLPTSTACLYYRKSLSFSSGITGAVDTDLNQTRNLTRVSAAFVFVCF